jgi:hypothetical protein
MAVKSRSMSLAQRSSEQDIIPGRPTTVSFRDSAVLRSSSPSLDNLKTIVIYGGVGLIIAGGAFVGIRYLIRNYRKNSTAKDSLDYGSASSYATRLKMAFENDNYFGWGTNLTEVSNVFNEISSKDQYAAIEKAYSALYPGKQLNLDLKDELTTKEYNDVMNTLSYKPQK